MIITNQDYNPFMSATKKTQNGQNVILGQGGSPLSRLIYSDKKSSPDNPNGIASSDFIDLIIEEEPLESNASPQKAPTNKLNFSFSEDNNHEEK